MDASIHRNVFVVFVQTVTAMVGPGLGSIPRTNQLPIDLLIDPALMTVVGVDLDVLGNLGLAAVGQPSVPPP